MRKTLSILLFFLEALPACTVRRAAGSSTREEGYVYCRLARPRAEVRLFGDYWVHLLKSRYYPGLSKKFLASLLQRTGELQPVLFFASHTDIPPYYAATGLVYKQAEEKTVLTDLLKNLRERFRTKAKQTDTFSVSGLYLHKLDYTVLNPETRTHTVHKDYLFSHGQTVFRFLFWTTDNNAETFAAETDAIINTIKF